MLSWLFLSAVGLPSSQDAVAQEEGGNGSSGSVYGFSSIDFDEKSNEVTGYSETDADPQFNSWYLTHVSGTLTDQTSGKYLASQIQNGYTSSSVTLMAAGTPAHTYEMSASHYLTPVQMDSCPGCVNEYNDEYFMQLYRDYAIDEPYASVFPQPQGYPPAPVQDSAIILGQSYDSASLTTPKACGDIRDTIIKDYITQMVAHTPTCDDFTESNQTPYSLNDLQPDETASYKPWAIIQPYFVSNLWNTQLSVNGLGPDFNITSGYRDPLAEIAAAKKNNVTAVRNSRHEYGDAVDIAPMTQVYWTKIQRAAHHFNACVEPYAQAPSHAHLDWRSLASVSWGKAPCGLTW